jgi:hypothetical protein
MPPERDPRLAVRVIRLLFYTPGFLALLLIKSGEPTGFGVTIEFLMLASAASVVAGLLISTQSSGGTADAASKVATWSGALVLELLGVVSFLNAVPPMFHQLAHSSLLKALAPGATAVSLGHTEFIPAVAIIPFMVYQLAGFGTLNYVVPKAVNWLINLAILALIVVGYVANREGNFSVELTAGATLVLLMAATVVYGVLRLKQMQTIYDLHCPPKEGKHHGHADEA